MSAAAKTTQSRSNNDGKATVSSVSTSVKNISDISKILENPLYTFASDASPEFQTKIDLLVKGMARRLDHTLTLSALGGDEEVPFGAIRDGDVVHLMYPQHVKEGDLFAAIITVLASQIPTCVIHESSAGWSEPEWSAESRRHLGGLLSGIQRKPDSFAHTSAPADLARISLWITTCAAALSQPGGVTDAQGDVLPSSVGGQKSASKYMSRVMASLRAGITDEKCVKAIETLSILLKLWQKAHYSDALSIVRKCKLPWSSVLFRAAPTETIKGKKNRPDQTVIRSPPKPSRSPWLASAERAELGNLYKDDWSFLEDFRSRWNKLEALQQHRQFNTFIRDIKAKYEELNSISNSVHAKLGKRKYWIERICKQDGYKPKVKKGESESFLLAAHFFKKDLSKLDIRVKKIFSPLQYLDNTKYPVKSTWGQLLDGAEDSDFTIQASAFSLDEEGECFRLWQIWAEIFVPTITNSVKRVDDPPLIDTYNPFSVLPQEDT